MQRRIKHIFSINTGRSGSHYLSQLFQNTKNCKAFHEAQPIGNGEAMRKYLRGEDEPMKQLAQEKVARIHEVTDRGNVYVETNHCFIKGFGWFLPELLPQEEIGVVILHRDKNEVIRSFLRKGTSPLLPKGRDWLITPDIKQPIVPPPHRLISAQVTYQLFRIMRLPFRGRRLYRRLNRFPPVPPDLIQDYEVECLGWYIDEVTALSKRYIEQFPDINYIEVTVNELNTLSGVRRLVDFFELEMTDSLQLIVGQATNLKERKFSSNYVNEQA